MGGVWVDTTLRLSAIEKCLKEQLKDTDAKGIEIDQIHVLIELFQKDGLHASDLARRIGRAVTSFTPLLDRLETAALIERKPDTKDRRAIKVCLTGVAWRLKNTILIAWKHCEKEFGDKG